MTTTSAIVRGTRVDALDLRAAVAEAERWILEGDRGHVCFVNVHLVETARRDPRVARAIASARMALPDGAPIAWALSHAHQEQVRRVAGSDFFAALCATRPGALRHFFFGSTEATLDRLTARLERALPTLVVAGRAAPPTADVDALRDDRWIDRIAAARPDVLWVGLGAPKQELWMEWARERLDVPVIAGVGAVFDFAAGLRRRAPARLQTAGLEWAFRLAVEPRRLWRRYLTTNATFVGGVAVESARRGRLRR